MFTSSQENAQATEATVIAKQPRSLRLATKGIKTAQDLVDLECALVSDVITGRVTTDVANSASNAAGKVLKAVEMQYRYGRGHRAPNHNLQLSSVRED